RIVGIGKVGKVTEEPGTGKATKTFRAFYDEYQQSLPPRLLTADDDLALASLEGFNVQHSIHRITKGIFEKLRQPARAWIFQANPTLYDVRGALKALKVDTWLVSRYDDEIRTGDRVYLWESGKEAGIVGLAEVIEEAKLRSELPASLRF